MNYRIWPRPASVISVARPGYRHFAIVSDYWDYGTPMVTSFEPDGLKTISMLEFSPNGDWQDEGYWSDLPEWEVLTRALSFYDRRYDLVWLNCEHHVRFAHGKKMDSPQVKRGLLLGIALAGVALLASK